MNIVKIHMIASGQVICKHFRLPKGKKWYTNAYKDNTKDRKRIRASDKNGNSIYFKPHTLVVIE